MGIWREQPNLSGTTICSWSKMFYPQVSYTALPIEPLKSPLTKWYSGEWYQVNIVHVFEFVECLLRWDRDVRGPPLDKGYWYPGAHYHNDLYFFLRVRSIKTYCEVDEIRLQDPSSGGHATLPIKPWVSADRVRTEHSNGWCYTKNGSRVRFSSTSSFVLFMRAHWR